MRSLLTALVLLLLPARAVAFDHSYQRWQQVLTEMVDESGVDWNAAARQPLDEVALEFAQADPIDMASWSREQKLAFYLNAWNLHMVRWVVEEDLTELIDYDRRTTRRRQTVAGREVPLSFMAHVRIRPNDPRTLWALACAARSCPELASTAYRAGLLDRQLRDAERRFFNDSRLNRVDRESGRVYLSHWAQLYGADFLTRADEQLFAEQDDKTRAVLSVWLEHASSDDARWLRSGGFEVVWLEPDWGIDHQP